MQTGAMRLARAPRKTIRIGVLPVDSVSIEDSAKQIIDYCRSEIRAIADRPLYSTSVNGQVIALCATNRDLAESIRAADVVNADGQPLVLLSRWLCAQPLPERVATTDLFPAVARRAAAAGVTFYMLGATEATNRAAARQVAADYPGLRIVGRRNGFFRREDEASIVADIARLKPDILWLSLGAPLEQQFCVRHLAGLRGVGVVKTAGGLFDFLSLAKPRAPVWMQRAGLEWLFRTWREPRRLLTRYLVTNPQALALMLRGMR